MAAPDSTELRVELARQNMTRRSLAERLAVPPSTLSSWLHGAAPAPRNLAARIENALRLEPGALTRNHSVQ
jgi:transcriptional regulator with XRE-family HTH domain